MKTDTTVKAAGPRVLRVQLQRSDESWCDVGQLVHSNETTRFESFTSYWNTAGRPVLGQLFEEYGPEWRPSQRVTLPPWFSHLLPEGYVRSLVANAIEVSDKREFFLLARLGEDDLPGALRVIEDDELLSVLEPHDHEEHLALEDDNSPFLKFSLAGIQPKFSLFMDGQRGLTIPARGQAGNWILKLPDGRPGFENVPHAEFGALELAKAIGIDVPDTMLLFAGAVSGLPSWAYSDQTESFAIRRFDRRDGDARVHAEVLAQVLDVPTANEGLKYKRANFETVGSILTELCGFETLAKVLDRLVLNVLIGNGDAHLKNWAVIYPDGLTPKLSPLYDVLPTVLYIENDDMGLKLNGSREFKRVDSHSFDRLATRVGQSASETRRYVKDKAHQIASEWQVLTDYLTNDQYAALLKHRDGIPLLRSPY